ncbi:MAG: hypothetical protein AMXMBFR33_10960 [Candidatus Xenobia bacterium]
MDSLARIVRELIERARAGPLSDERQMVANMVYIREQLEAMHQRHGEPRDQPEEEELRNDLRETVDQLYRGLEDLEQGILDRNDELLEIARTTLLAALKALAGLEQRADNLAAE